MFDRSSAVGKGTSAQPAEAAATPGRSTLTTEARTPGLFEGSNASWESIDPAENRGNARGVGIATAPARSAASLSVQRKAWPGTETRHDEHALENAKKKLASLDARLGVELAQIGPALTTRQKLDYIHRFHALDEYKKTKQDIVRAERELRSDLKGRDGKMLEALARRGDDDSQDTLIKAYGELATTDLDGAITAMLWADDKLKDKKFGNAGKLHEVIAHAEDTFAGKLVEQAQHRISAGQILGAAQYVKEQVGRVKSVISVGNLPHLIDQFVSELKHPKGAKAARQAKLAAKLAQEVRGSHVVRKVGRGLFAAIGIAEATEGLSQKQLAALNAFQGEAKTLLALMKNQKQLELVQRRLKVFSKHAKRVVRFLPILGVATNAQDLVKDIDAAIHDPSVAHIAMAVGHFVSMVGSALEMAPPPIDVIGAGLNVIGGAITAVVSLFSGPSQEQKDERKILGDMGMNRNQQGAFTGGFRHNDEFSNSSVHNLAAAEQAGMTPQQIQRAAALCPDLFSREFMFEHLHNCFQWLKQPTQGALKGDFVDFVMHCAPERGFQKAGAGMLMGSTFSSVPGGPSRMTAHMLGPLLTFWRILHRPRFAHLPNRQWGEVQGVDDDDWRNMWKG